MPSPIAHAAVGYALYRLYMAQTRPIKQSRIGSWPRLAIIASGLSLLPDLDFVPGFFFPGAFDQFHNTFANSIFTGLGVALGVGALARLWRQKGFWFWFLFTLISYELHVLMDYFTVGRGVMLFWPFTAQRFEPPFKLFYGLHRSDGWLSIRHLWTLVTELGFVILLGFAVQTAVTRIKKQYEVNDACD